MRTTLRARLIAPVALAALVIGMPSAAQAATPPASGDAQASSWAAHFLASQLNAGGHFLSTPPDPVYGSWPDVGNTVDAILALAGAKEGGTEAAAALTWVQGQAPSYTEWTDAWADPANPVTYAIGGASGKLAVLAAAEGVDPHAFGGVDLIARIQGLATPGGRFGDANNDFGVTINQAWAILGLQRTGAPVPAPAVTYLGAQQCADGGVRKDLDVDPCVGDIDATAFAAQAFLAAGDTGAATKALDFLQAQQAADGSYLNSSGEGANTNSTGVAAQAFTAGGRTAASTKANGFLRGMQWGCEVAVSARGGIAFTKATSTVDDNNVARAVRATPQALLGLSGGSLVTVSNAGQAPATTAMDCTPVTEPTDTPTDTPTTTPTTTPESTTTIPPTAAPMLAETGKDVSVPVTLGAVLVLLGAALIGLRRRGLHS